MEEAIILIYHDQKLRRGPPPDTERTRSQRGDRITANMLKDNPGVDSNAILTRLPRRETTLDGRWTIYEAFWRFECPTYLSKVNTMSRREY